LIVIADGCTSKFRKEFIKTKPVAKSHFVGMILKDCVLPQSNHGHVILAKPSPILLYQISDHDTRVLVDIPSPMPSNTNGDMMIYMKEKILPQLPKSIQPSFVEGLKTERIRSMPNSWLPPSKNTAPGLIMIGDSQNMRHPLTGGGMSVAFWDVVELNRLLENVPDLTEFSVIVDEQLQKHRTNRKACSSVINILANALYELFSAGDDPYVGELQNACFAYFKLGGRCVSTPAGLLGGVIQEPLTLVGHFFAVAIYGTWLIVTRSVLEFPLNLIKACIVLYQACIIIGPLMLAELK
jgi:squalene monooxygenase